MRLIKCCFLLFTASLTVSQTCASQTTPTIQQEQIALWDAVIAGDVTKALASIKAGADVNGLDTRENMAGPNGRRPLNYAALRNDTAMITALLDAGAMINLANRSGFRGAAHLRQIGSAPQVTEPESGRNPGKFQTAV